MDLRLNKLRATVKNQKYANGLAKIEAVCGDTVFSLIMFEDEPEQKVGDEVWLIIKESEIAIAKADIDGISISNRIRCDIKNINSGEILSEVSLLFPGGRLNSFITTDSLNRLSLCVNDTVYAYIKANEIYLEDIND